MSEILDSPIDHEPLILFKSIYYKKTVFLSERALIREHRLQSGDCSELMTSKAAAALMEMKSFGTKGRSL